MGRLDALREELIAKSNELDTLFQKDSLTAEERSRVTQLNGEIVDIEPQITEAREIADRLAKYSKDTTHTQQRASGRQPLDENGKPVVDERKQEEPRDTRPWGQRVAESESFKEFVKNPKGTSDPVDVRSFRLAEAEQRTLIYGGALSADQVRPQLQPGIIRPNEPLGTLAMRDVLLSGTTTADAITYILENVFTNNAAAVAEAVSTSTGLKPESALTFQQATAPVTTLAHWIPITRQALDDTAQLRMYVEDRLMNGLNRVESDQIINGSGSGANLTGILNQSGIQVLDATYFTGAPVNGTGTGAANYNRLLRAKTKIMLDGDASATFIALNPLAWEKMITSLNGDGNYYGLGPFGNDDQPRLWGLPVVLTEGLAATTALVGDGTMAAVWDRMMAQVLIADQHADFFIRNIFVLLAEERLALTVYRPVAFASVLLV